MNFWLLALFLFEILFIIISFSVSMTVYKLHFLESVSLIGDIFSIKSVLFCIIFLMLQNKQSEKVLTEIKKERTN